MVHGPFSIAMFQLWLDGMAQREDLQQQRSEFCDVLVWRHTDQPTDQRVPLNTLI